MKHAFVGCSTALVTPFRDGKVDFAALEALVEWQIASGIDGLVAVGTTGESATLAVDEHIAVIKAVVGYARGRVPVIAGTGANATTEAIELAQAAQDVGADALLQVTPYYNRPQQEGMYRHFMAVADHAKLPVLLYNVPTRTGSDLLPDTVVRLAAHDRIIGIKEALGQVARYTELLCRVPKDFLVLSGDDASTFPLYALGGHGVISVVSNVAPAAMAAMWDHALAGDWAAARRQHLALHSLIGLLFAEASPAPAKAALATLGKMSPEVRLPLVSASDELRAKLQHELQRLGLL